MTGQKVTENGNLSALGVKVIPSRLLPIKPTLEQYVIRCVRHGLADVLEQLGEDVGPAPDDQVHTMAFGDTLFVSHATYDRLKRMTSPNTSTAQQ